MTQRKKYGEKWRVLAHRADGTRLSIKNDGCFDELVFENILHIEQMDNRQWWMQLGDARFWIKIPARGKPQITITGFNEYDPKCEWTFHAAPPGWTRSEA